MGTRSKTSFIEKRGENLTHLVSVYQQYDGYIEGVGYNIAKYILSKKICNGIPLGRNKDNLANGFDCLVAQFIRDFKTEVGNLYITTQDNEQEYNYDVIFDNDLYFSGDIGNDNDSNDYFNIIVRDWDGEKIFEGSPRQLLNFKESSE